MTKEEKAIKGLKDILAEATETNNAVCYVTSDDADVLKEAIKALEQEPRWIPVSEKLPNKNGKYLTTIDRCMGGKCVELLDFALDLFKIDKFDFNDKKGVSGWYVYDAEWGYYEVDNVVAWMPLPQAYGTESEEV